MRAIVRDKYGSPDGALELREIDAPAVKDDEVLVRVRAASANTYDVDLPTGLRYMGRVAARLRKPTNSVPGLDLAGQVDAVGKNAKQAQRLLSLAPSARVVILRAPEAARVHSNKEQRGPGYSEGAH